MPVLQKVMPLTALNAVVLDLETTGLDVRADRVVQLGAVRLEQGRVAADLQLDLLVNPQMDVPLKSVRIHGLDNQRLAGAPDFATVFAQWQEFAADLPVVGYNIGFDLAVLQQETQRAGLDWQLPPALCLRLLGAAILGKGEFAILSDLESLARHFGLSVAGRHSALGDALMTARIYEAMVPEMQAAGVQTFAEALARIASLTHERDDLARAGWADIAEGLIPRQASQATASSLAAGQAIDPYAFRHRLGELAHSPAVLLPPTASLAEAAAIMIDQASDCVFVGRDHGHIEGIVSERDITRILAKMPDKAASQPLARVMSGPVHGLPEDAYLYVGLGRMARLGHRHLAVLNRQGQLSGWVSARDLVHARGQTGYGLGDAVHQAESAADLAQALASLPQIAAGLLAENVAARDIARLISAEYLRAAERAAALAAEHMQADGKGPPPCAWALLVLGSAGRGESLLAADQDHAIIFEDGAGEAENEERRRWFMTFGSHLSDILDAARIPYCKGGVMSKNPQWCRSFKEWRQAVSGWVRRAEPADLLNVDIFFDFVPVAGFPELADRLAELALTPATRKAGFLKTLAGKAASYRTPRTLFGGFKPVAGRLDLKQGGLLPIVEMARLLAIAQGSIERSTPARLGLKTAAVNTPVTVQQLEQDHAFLIALILGQQLDDLANGVPPGSKVAISRLTPEMRKRLKDCFARIETIGDLLRDILFS